MRQINPDHVKAIAQTVNSCPYFTLLSMELKSLDFGQSRLEVEVQEKHLQPYGIVHGGVCASIMDAAVYWAVYAGMERTMGLTTIEIKLNYLSPVSGGRLIARGRSLKIGKNICLGEAGIENETGDLVGHGTSTLMVLDSLKINGHDRLPTKFLD